MELRLENLNHSDTQILDFLNLIEVITIRREIMIVIFKTFRKKGNEN